MTSLFRVGQSGALAAGILFVIYLASLLPQGARQLGAITNIRGIPYPETPQGAQISQTLAHADLYLKEPVLGKRLTLSFSYSPLTSDTLAVGVRENDFWLSYTPVLFYQRNDDESGTEWRAASVSIPLTDKLQEPDRSIDVMFIANGNPEAYLNQELDDDTLWYLRDVQTQVSYHRPSRTQVQDYLRAILKRERAL